MSLIRRHPLLSVVSLLLLASFAAVAFSAITVWRSAHRDGAADVEQADAIIVLGAAQYDGTPSPVFKGRLDHAALLYGQDRAAMVMVLGSNQPGDRTTEAEAGRAYLIEQGVPETAVTAVPVGHSTYESLQAAARQMRERRLNTAFLVSDPWHNARIQAMASDLGFTGYPSATWTSAAKTEGTRVPGYIRETFAYLAYRILGG
ncbi:MAG TPA: YdcF family protein [Actinomycetota bacterium]